MAHRVPVPVSTGRSIFTEFGRLATLVALAVACTLSLTLFVPGGRSASAQQPGDGIVPVVINNATQYLVVPMQSGLVRTLFSSPTGSHVVEPTPANDGFAWIAGTNRTLLRYDGRRSTTLALLTGQSPVGVKVEQSGDYLVLDSFGAVYRVAGGGGSPQRLATFIPGGGAALDLEEDLRTGDWLVLSVTHLHRFDANGGITSVRHGIPAGPGPGPAQITGDMRTDPDTGMLIVTSRSELYRIDPATGATTSLFPRSSGFANVAYNPYDRYFYTTTPGSVLRYDVGANRLQTIRTIPAPTSNLGRPIGDYGVWAGRTIAGRSPPGRQSIYQIDVSIPTEPNRAYVAAAAFGTFVGFPAGPAGRVPLDADPLFFLSFQVPQWFENFQGFLDGGGRATLKLHIPKEAFLEGLRLFVAAATYDTTQIRFITPALGVRIL